MNGIDVPELREHFDHTTESFSRDAQHIYREMRSSCPIVHSDQHGGFWAVSKYETIIKILRQPQIFASGDGVILPSLQIPTRGIPTESDPPAHTEYRAVFLPFLTPKAVASYEPMVRDRVRALLDTFIEDGRADFVAKFAKRLPGQVVAEFFGFDLHDGERCYEMLSTVMAPPDGDLSAALKAAQDLLEFIGGALARTRAEPKDNLMSAIVTHVTKSGTQFTDEECLGLAFTALGGALETTVSGLTSTLALLDRFPDVRAQLIADPTLADRAVQEILRMEAPAHCPARTVRSDMELDGVNFHAGDRVLMLFGSGNYDDEKFESPELFKLDRPRNPHLAFGHGIHRCVGAPLAELELRVTLEEILTRMPDFRVISQSGPAIRSGSTFGYESLEIEFTPSRPVGNG